MVVKNSTHKPPPTEPTMGHPSMAITRNNGGFSKNHLSSLQHGGAYHQAYSQSSDSDEQGGSNKDVLPIMLVVGVAGLLLLGFLCCGRNDAAEEQEAGDGNRAGQPQPQPPPVQSNEAGGRWADDASTVAAVEVVPVRTAEPPLVCTYGKADGWGETSCGVCLADLADGEAVRVLPACLHYFHAACVNMWLRGHDTCPLCRAPLVAPDGTAT